MTVSRVSVNTGTGAGATVTTAWQAGHTTTVAGNLLLLQVGQYNGLNSDPGDQSITGWTKITSGAAVNGIVINRGTWYYKVAAGSDAAPSIPNAATNNVAWLLEEWSGLSATSPSDAHSTPATATSGTGLTCGGVTTTNAADWIWYGASITDSAGTSVAWTGGPTVDQAWTLPTTNLAISSATQTVSSTGTNAYTGTVTVTGGAYSAAVVASLAFKQATTAAGSLSLTGTATHSGVAAGSVTLGGGAGTAASRTNLCPNPSFDDGTTTNWAALSGTITADTTYARSGTYSMKVAGPASVNDVIYATSFPVLPGQPYTVSGYVQVPTVLAESIQPIGIQWYDAGAAFISSTGSALLSTTTGGFMRFSVTGTAPSNAAVAYIFTSPYLGLGAGEAYWIDDILCEAGSALLPFFNGATPSTWADKYAWTGTAHRSSSTDTALVAATATPTGSLTLAGTGTAVAPTIGALTLAGTGTAKAPATASGALSLAGTATQSSTAAGALTLAGSASGRASPTATGSVALAGTAIHSSTAVGGVTLAGAAIHSSGASGAVALAGTGTHSSTAAGTVTLTGTATQSSQATGGVALTGTGVQSSAATGSVTFTSTAGAMVAASAAGTVTFAGTTGTTNTATAAVTLTASAAASVGASAAGSVTLTSTAGSSAAGSGAGAVTFTGTASTSIPATGAMTLTSTALAIPTGNPTGSVTFTSTAGGGTQTPAAGGLTFTATASPAVVTTAGGTVTFTVTVNPSAVVTTAGALTLAMVAAAYTARDVTIRSGPTVTRYASGPTATGYRSGPVAAARYRSGPATT